MFCFLKTSRVFNTSRGLLLQEIRYKQDKAQTALVPICCGLAWTTTNNNQQQIETSKVWAFYVLHTSNVTREKHAQSLSFCQQFCHQHSVFSSHRRVPISTIKRSTYGKPWVRDLLSSSIKHNHLPAAFKSASLWHEYYLLSEQQLQPSAWDKDSPQVTRVRLLPRPTLVAGASG